jgi:HD-like signal output (HDOD) protein
MATPILRIEDIVGKTADLPSLPVATLAVMRETQSATGTAASVAMQLERDQALTARVLRLSNSAYYGFSRKILDLREAVMVLGMRNIRNLALVASTYPWLVKPLRGYGLGPNELWSHASAVGVGARMVARRAGKRPEENAFTVGLLHNIGKIALSVWLDGRMDAMLELAERENLSFDQVEDRVFGFNHADIGAHLSESWQLPVELIEAIRFHHRPTSAPEGSWIADTIHVGDRLANVIGVNSGGEGAHYHFDEASLERLGIMERELDDIAEETATAFDQHQKLFEDVRPAA